jgi:hypothetical protein
MGTDEQRLTRYVVELRRPALGWEDVHTLGESLRASAEGLRAEGKPVRFLRTVHVPEDDSCFLLFEAPSAAVVKQAVRRATPAVKRITEVIHNPC